MEYAMRYDLPEKTRCTVKSTPLGFMPFPILDICCPTEILKNQYATTLHFLSMLRAELRLNEHSMMSPWSPALLKMMLEEAHLSGL